MKKPIHFFMVMLLALAAQAFFIGCSSETGSEYGTNYYTITYHKNYEGAYPATHSDYCAKGESLSLPSEKRKGYKFLGWAKKADAAAPEYNAGDSVKVEASLSFYALWKKVDSFKVTFDAGFIKDGESAAETKTQNVTVSSSSEKFILDKNTFTRDGYVFAGWRKSSSSSSYGSYNPVYKDAESVEYFYEDTTLYALWLEQSKSIKITYNKNDGTATPEETSYYVEKGKSFTLKANTFTRDGKTFAGWSKSKSSKKKEYADKAELWYSSEINSDITLYALWHDDAHYVITYYSNFEGSTYDYKEQTLAKSESGATGNLLKNTFERTGYVFYGWYTSSSLPKYGTRSDFYTDESKITLTKDADLYACWLEDKSSEAVKLTFNKNDGTATPEETSQYVKYGSKPSYSYYGNDTNYNKLKPNTFIRENYEFLGWSNSSSATSAAYTDAQTDVYFTSNMTLYAVWQYKGPVVITFDGNGGKDSDGNTTATQTITANTYTELKANTFAKENYGFAGWAKTSSAADREYGDKESVKFFEPAVTLYAVWKPNLVITFNGNGGATSGGKTTATQSIPYGVSTALNENPFTKSGSTFIGWHTSASTNDPQYSDKGSISIYEDTTLYAIWKDDIVLTFNANGGVGSDITKNVAYNTASYSYKFTVPENTFTRAGYVFMGWGTSASSNQVSYKAGRIIYVSENKTLYAIWAKESVPVTFDPNTENGGSGTAFTQNLSLNTTTLKYEGTLPANTFTNSNGNFVGWSTYKKPNSTYSIMGAGLELSLSYSQLPNSEGFTLYAVWNPKKYTVTYSLGGNGTDIVKTVTNTAEYGNSMNYALEAAPASNISYYSFRGWSNNSVSTYPQFTAGQTVTLNGNKTFYAVWKLDGAILKHIEKQLVGSGARKWYDFILLNTETIKVNVDADGRLDFYMMTEEEGIKFANGNGFKYMRAVSGENTTSVSGTITLTAGKYRYGVNNGNILVSKKYKIKIEPAN